MLLLTALSPEIAAARRVRVRAVGVAYLAALAVAVALAGTAATWPGILLAYDSYYWTSGGRAWPVSFFVVAVAVLGYLLTYARLLRRGQAAREPENQEAP